MDAVRNIKTWSVFGLVVCLLALTGASAQVFAGPLEISIEPTRALRGDTLSVEVTGGTPDGVVMIQFDDPMDPVWADQGNFDDDGEFDYELTIPAEWRNGRYTVRVKDVKTGEIIPTSFQIVSRPTYPGVPPKNPVALASGARRALVGREVLFVGLGSRDPDGSIVKYSWDFGDGSTASGVKVYHSFASAGVYTVILTVTDNIGLTDSDTLEVTVEDLPLTPVSGLDHPVSVNETNYLCDATVEADTTVRMNTTGQVTFSILKYPENPYPDVPLPEHSLLTVIDLFVSDPDAVEWPIYVERYYTDEEVAGLQESLLGIYYFRDGGWHRCRETGAYPELNTVWAWMYEDEVTGSPTVIGEAPAAAAFELSELTVSPPEVEPGEAVEVSVVVTNVGNRTGEHNVTLRIEGEAVVTKAVTLDPGASATVVFTVEGEAEGTYLVEVDGLTGSLVVKTPTPPPPPPPPPKPAEFEFSGLKVEPEEAAEGEGVTIKVEVENIGEEKGTYILKLNVDGVVTETATVTLDGGDSTTVFFTVTESEGEHTVEVEGLTGSFIVTAPPTVSIWMRPGYVAGILIVVIAVATIIYAFWKGKIPHVFSTTGLTR